MVCPCAGTTPWRWTSGDALVYNLWGSGSASPSRPFCGAVSWTAAPSGLSTPVWGAVDCSAHMQARAGGTAELGSTAQLVSCTVREQLYSTWASLLTRRMCCLRALCCLQIVCRRRVASRPSPVVLPPRASITRLDTRTALYNQVWPSLSCVG